MSSDPTRPDAGAVTEDLVLGGRVRILQPRRGHRVGHDAILLAAASGAKPSEHAVDLGAGVGGAGLALARRVPGLRVTLIERDAELVALAREAIARNDLAERARAVALDVTETAEGWCEAGLAPGSADRVLMNPPFNDPRRHRSSPHPARASAHVAATDGLLLWTESAARLLRPHGELVLIYRADALAEVIEALAGRFGALVLRPVHPRPAAAAIRVLVRAVRGARAPLTLLPGFVLNDGDGKPTPDAEAVLRNATALPFVAG